jgi:hypothetical protein
LGDRHAGIVGDNDQPRVFQHGVERRHELTFRGSIHLLTPDYGTASLKLVRGLHLAAMAGDPLPATLCLSNRAL